MLACGLDLLVLGYAANLWFVDTICVCSFWWVFACVGLDWISVLGCKLTVCVRFDSGTLCFNGLVCKFEFVLLQGLML